MTIFDQDFKIKFVHYLIKTFKTELETKREERKLIKERYNDEAKSQGSASRRMQVQADKIFQEFDIIEKLIPLLEKYHDNTDVAAKTNKSVVSIFSFFEIYEKKGHTPGKSYTAFLLPIVETPCISKILFEGKTIHLLSKQDRFLGKEKGIVFHIKEAPELVELHKMGNLVETGRMSPSIKIEIRKIYG